MNKKLRNICMYGGILLLSIFTGCKNFLNGSDILTELENAIEYTNAPTFTVLIASTDGSGSFLTGNGEKNLKVGDSVEVEFKVSDAWQFQKWIAVDKDDQSKNLTNYIKFSDSTSTKTTVTLLTECENILVMPKCVERLKITSYSPDSQNEVPYNTDISINFNYNISQSSVTFTPEELESLEIDDSYELIKIKQPDNSEAVYGYRKNNITYYKNIEITSLTGEKLNGYFNPPQIIGGKTLLITKNNVPFIFDSTKQKTVIVTVASDFSEKTGISIGSKQASFSYTINNVSKIADPSIKIDFLTNEEYGTITPNQTTECLLQKDYEISFIESKGYKFVRWEPVYNDGTNDSAKDIIQIKDENSKTTTFQLKYAIPGLAIKAVCEKRPEVKEVYPLNLSSGVLRNADIKITFSEPIQDLAPEYFDFGSEKCVISLKDASGSSLNKNYTTPFVNYDKKTVVIPCNYSGPVTAYTRVIVNIDVSVFMNKNNVAVSDESSLYSWEFTVGDKIENTAPVIKEIKLAATEDNIQSTSVSNWFSLPDDDFPVFNPQNHAGKTIYGYINTYDNESRAKYLYVTETLVQDLTGNNISYAKPYTGKQQLVFETQMATDTYFSYTFNTSSDRVDGIYKLEFYVEDDFEDALKKQSDVSVFYVVKDTECVNSENLTITNSNTLTYKQEYSSQKANGRPTYGDSSVFSCTFDSNQDKVFEISGLTQPEWYMGYQDSCFIEVYYGDERTENGTGTKLLIHHNEQNNTYSFSVKSSEIDGSKDMFFRIVISDLVDNTKAFYIAYPKNPVLNFISVNENFTIVPNVVDSEADGQASVKYAFMLKDSADSKEKLIVMNYSDTDSNAAFFNSGYLADAKINENNTYDIYIVPAYDYSTGMITGLPYKVLENFSYKQPGLLNIQPLLFDTKIVNNNNGTITIQIIPTSQIEQGVDYSIISVVDGISQKTTLDKPYFIYPIDKPFTSTITTCALKNSSAMEHSEIVDVNYDFYPPLNEKPFMLFYDYREGQGNDKCCYTDYNTVVFKSPVVDKHNHLYDTENPPAVQELYISEDGSDFINKGVKISVPVMVNSATNIKYRLDLRYLKYNTYINQYNGRTDYIAKNCLYGVFTDTFNNTYEGLFTEGETRVCTIPVSYTYDSNNKILSINNLPSYYEAEGVNLSSSFYYLDRSRINDCKGYIEILGNDNKWRDPNLSGEANLRWVHIHREDYNKNGYRDPPDEGDNTFNLSEAQNNDAKVIRIYMWYSRTDAYSFNNYRFLPAYCFKGVTTSLPYATLIAGKNEVTLIRDTNANIPTFVHVMYSNYDYGDDAGLWEIGGYETASEVVTGPKTIKISDDKNNPNYVPKGMYYTCIAHYADGTTSISDVSKK